MDAAFFQMPVPQHLGVHSSICKGTIIDDPHKCGYSIYVYNIYIYNYLYNIHIYILHVWMYTCMHAWNMHAYIHDHMWLSHW